MSQNTNLAKGAGVNPMLNKIPLLIEVELLFRGIPNPLDIVQYHAEIQYDQLPILFPLFLKILDPYLQDVND